MRKTQQLSITLPADMVDLVRIKVQAGEYAREREVIHDGLRALNARDRAVENWLHDEVRLACEALKVDSSRALSPQQVRVFLDDEYAKLP